MDPPFSSEVPAASSGEASPAVPRGLVLLVSAIVASVVAVVGVAVAGGWWLWMLLFMLATLAARYRPLGGASLGLGAVVLPAAADRLMATEVVVLAASAALAARWLDLRARARRRRPETGVPIVVLALPGLLAAAGSVGALGVLRLGWIPVPPPPAHGTVAALGYASFGLLVVYGIRRAVAVADGQMPWSADLARTLSPGTIAIDALGWWLGALAATAPWPAAWPLLFAVALLAAEVARQSDARRQVAGQADDLERLQLAHRRILSQTGGMVGIAAQFLVECENVLPLDTFQLEIVDEPPDSRRSFVAGPGRMLGEGMPVLAPMPPMLPGIHKRVSWRIIEHELRARGEEGGALLGILRLWCDPRRLELRDEALLASLIPHLSSSLHRARLDREAKHDPLTGVPVRRVLERRLQEVYRLACDEGKPMAVILCDVDHFKRVNDTYGHDAGDQALIAVAKALDAGRRDKDLLCRYGGEEFTLLLEASTGEGALMVAERLRLAVNALRVEYEGERLPLALSAGVAAFPELHVKTGSELLLLADEALYAAKEGGRNRCLLNEGRGRFVDGDGKRYGTLTETPPAVPRLFR